MIKRRFDEISPEDIHALVENAVPEGRTIDYKAELPGGGNEDKKEFLADVSSFANAAGGDLLFGIEEERDAAGQSTGLPDAATGLVGINADNEILRLESMVRDGVAPRIQGIRTKAVHGFPDGPVIVMRIPNSWASPHMVVFRNWSRFFSRTSNGKYQLDVTEIRAAFALSGELSERITRFRDKRIGKIMADATPVPLEPNPKVILHMLPLSAFDPGSVTDVTADLTPDMRNLVEPIDFNHSQRRYNLDGFVSYRSQDEVHPITYVQLFRSGVVEAVSAYILREWQGEKTIPTSLLEESLNDAMRSYLRILGALEVGMPIYVNLSLIGAKGYELVSSRIMRHRVHQPRVIDRDVLIIPEAVVEELNVEPTQLLKPIYDTLWQSAGWERCVNYDEDGNWIRQR